MQRKPFENKTDKEVFVSVKTRQNVLITVSDNGIGIESINIERIFDFQNLQPKNSGMGLGLEL
jgi:signal transduction histidine kinase